MAIDLQFQGNDDRALNELAALAGLDAPGDYNTERRIRALADSAGVDLTPYAESDRNLIERLTSLLDAEPPFVLAMDATPDEYPWAFAGVIHMPMTAPAYLQGAHDRSLSGMYMATGVDDDLSGARLVVCQHRYYAVQLNLVGSRAITPGAPFYEIEAGVSVGLIGIERELLYGISNCIRATSYSEGSEQGVFAQAHINSGMETGDKLPLDDLDVSDVDIVLVVDAETGDVWSAVRLNSEDGAPVLDMGIVYSPETPVVCGRFLINVFAELTDYGADVGESGVFEFDLLETVDFLPPSLVGVVHDVYQREVVL